MQISGKTRHIANAVSAISHRSKLRGTDRILRLLFNPDRQQQFLFERPFFEYRYFGDAQLFLDWYVFFYGTYEADDVLLMRAILRQMDKPVALDIGANLGHHCLAMAALCSRVHAFEPYPPVKTMLQQRLSRNAVDNVSIHPFGLGDVDGEVSFKPPTENNISNGKFSEDGTLALAIRRGDALGLQKVDFIKIDVEGHEPQALIGLRETIARLRPVLLVEINTTLDAISSVLPSGYEFFQYVPQSRFLTSTRIARITSAHVGNVFAVPHEQMPGLGNALLG